jgi:hypothetical protein
MLTWCGLKSSFQMASTDRGSTCSRGTSLSTQQPIGIVNLVAMSRADLLVILIQELNPLPTLLLCMQDTLMRLNS